MKYNYVFYGATNSFLKHTLKDLEALDNACVKEDFLDSNSKALQLLFKAHTYPQLNEIVDLPGKEIWCKKCFNVSFDAELPVCFIFEAKYFGQDVFFSYLREQFPGCKLVLTFRDLFCNKKKWFKRLDIDDIKKKFDLIMSYDRGDCAKYGLTYFNLEASFDNQIIRAADYPWSDVVFIGRAKGREDRIVEAYNILHNAGLKCDFYIVGKEADRNRPGITYSKKAMPYEEMLKRTINSRCVLELSQEGEHGFTSRSQEAIMYNKQLITDSEIVKEQRFFPSKDILFISDVNEIDPSFVRHDDSVDYHYDGEYSPVRLLESIERNLNTAPMISTEQLYV